MTTRAQDRLERLLLALPHLADDAELPLAELAARVGTDVDTLLRDLEALTLRDRDVAGFVESIELYIWSGQVGARSAHFKRPMRLTRAEVAALDLGLGLLALERPLEERGTIVAARAHLRQAAVASPPVVRDGVTTRAPEGVAGGVQAEPIPDAQLEAFSRLWQAHEERRVVRLTYQRADEAMPEERIAHPWAIVRAHHHVYVVAWCATASGLRLFRLDRVRAVELDGDHFDVPTDFDVEQLLRDGRLFAGERPDDELVVRFTPHVARWIAERERVPLDADSSVTVSWPLADDDWAVRHVLQYGVDATVLSPARIRDAIVARLDALLAEPEPEAGPG
jgi:proteasome accessory factor C